MQQKRHISIMDPRLVSSPSQVGAVPIYPSGLRTSLSSSKFPTFLLIVSLFNLKRSENHRVTLGVYLHLWSEECRESPAFWKRQQADTSQGRAVAWWNHEVQSRGLMKNFSSLQRAVLEVWVVRGAGHLTLTFVREVECPQVRPGRWY